MSVLDPYSEFPARLATSDQLLVRISLSFFARRPDSVFCRRFVVVEIFVSLAVRPRSEVGLVGLVGCFSHERSCFWLFLVIYSSVFDTWSIVDLCDDGRLNETGGLLYWATLDVTYSVSLPPVCPTIIFSPALEDIGYCGGFI